MYNGFTGLVARFFAVAIVGTIYGFVLAEEISVSAIWMLAALAVMFIEWQLIYFGYFPKVRQDIIDHIENLRYRSFF